MKPSLPTRPHLVVHRLLSLACIIVFLLYFFKTRTNNIWFFFFEKEMTINKYLTLATNASKFPIDCVEVGWKCLGNGYPGYKCFQLVTWFRTLYCHSCSPKLKLSFQLNHALWFIGFFIFSLYYCFFFLKELLFFLRKRPN